MVPFQCDLCHFRNIMGRNQWNSKWEGHEILEHVQQAILNSFWSRESNTVAFNLLESKANGVESIGQTGDALHHAPHGTVSSER
jgi:hypothetical protein